jgi:hypoxanthine phosphoribosyltransferase
MNRKISFGECHMGVINRYFTEYLVRIILKNALSIIKECCEINSMSKQIKDINELVLTWDLNQELRNKKLEILKIWEKKLEKNDFETVLKICSNFNYYSESLTAQAYKEVFNNNASKINMFDTFLEQSLFLPLRRKERIESAVDMFSSFRLVNKLDANKTHVNGPADYLEKYKASKDYNSKIVKECDQEDDKHAAAIQILRKQIEAHSENQKVRSAIEKRIIKIQAIKTKRQQRIEKSVQEFHQNYLLVKKLIIIDDFIGTGDSVSKLLNEIHRILSDSGISIKLYLWVIEASESGMKMIKEKAEEFGIEIDISFYKKSIDVLAEDIIFSSDNIDEVKELIKKINKQIGMKPGPFCKNHAIASFVNAPNNNLTLLSEGNSNWTPLFLRTNRNIVQRNMSSTELKDTLQFLRQ